MSKLVPLGKTTVRLSLLTFDGSGVLVNADSLPTVLNVQKNGVDADESLVTITQAQDATPSNIVGNYIVTVNLSSTGLNAELNDDFIVTTNSVIDGTVTTDSTSFTVTSMSGQSPISKLG